MPHCEKQFSHPARKGAVANGLFWAAERNGGAVSFLAMSKVQRAFLRSLILVVLGCLVLAPAQAQFGQLGTKLVGTGASGPAQQGFSVSASNDGSTIIIGGPFDRGEVGAAWVYARSTTTWTKLTAGTGEETGNGEFGYSVAISSDGNTAVVGAPYNNCSSGNCPGAVWVFTQSGGVWSEQAGPLVASDATANARQGYSVAISGTSGNGQMMVVGGPADGSAGAVYTFMLSGGTWSELSKLGGSGASAGAQQGYSVGLSSDGNTLIFGAPFDSSSVGAAWVFIYGCFGLPVCTNQWEEDEKLVGTGRTGASEQGSSVALSLDGNAAIVGGPYDNSNAGAAWIYTRSGNAWSQVQVGSAPGPVVAGGATGAAQQGTGVGLSSDGTRAIVGGSQDNSGVGAAWIYLKQSNGGWIQSLSALSGGKLVATDYTGDSNQGAAVAFSGDGNTAVVGGPDDATSTGAAWAYIPVPDMAIAIAHNGTFSRGDTNDTYTIKVSNVGLASTNAEVFVTVPVPASSGLTLVSITGSGWTCSIASVTPTPVPPPPPGYPAPPGLPSIPTASCNRPATGGDALAAGSSFLNLTLTVDVSSSAPNAVTVEATVTGGGGIITVPTSSDLVQLPPVPVLSIAVSHSGALYPGRAVPYTILVSNTSLYASTSGTVTVTDTLPTGLSGPAITSDTGWSCSGSTTITCTRSDALAVSGAYPPINFTATVSLTPPPSIADTATVSGGGTLSSASATDTALVSASGPGLGLSLSHLGNFSKSASRAGTTAYSYVIIVSNNGGGATSGTITVNNTPPSALTPTAVSGGRGWSCTLGSPVSCSRSDPLPAGLAYFPITVWVTVGAGVTPTVSVPNNASVSGGSTSGTVSATDSIVIGP
jgi:uncharacterized repeat protein (TIGR01451 family)